jgi:hypothetical protein
MRKLFRAPHAWRPAGTSPEWMIVQLSNWTSSPVPVPDATWEHWSKNMAGVQTPSRDPAFRYISLAPDVNNAYAGNPANFPTSSVVAGGGTYAGNPASFPTSTTLPNGSPYAGNPASFPRVVQLIDDGDPAK